MNAQISMRMTVTQVEELMGVDGGSLGPIGWLVIQEESRGTERADIAKSLGVGIDDVEAMIHAVCKGVDKKESALIWMKGLVALRTAAMMTQGAIRQGWDTVEAMAVEKLGNHLAKMTTNGDADQMLKIATSANKAIRRGMGEGGDQRNRGPGGMQAEFGLTLKSGELGSIHLQLSPRIREQMQRSDRIIDVTPKDSNLGNSAMLGLNETRGLVEESTQAEVEAAQSFEERKKRKGFHFDFQDRDSLEDFQTVISGDLDMGE